MKTKKANIRIWIYWNEGIVRITIPRDGSFEVIRGGQTDEGWSSYGETFEHDSYDDTITRTCCNDGRDCDGRLTSVSVFKWTVGNGTTQMHQFTDDGGLVLVPERQPDWITENGYQRDEYAEAAGY